MPPPLPLEVGILRKGVILVDEAYRNLAILVGAGWLFLNVFVLLVTWGGED
jgi:hypothetical protein